MVLSEDSDDHLFKKHQDLCSKLNLDINTITEAWEIFQNIQTNYTLEGDSLHWLCCAVYVVCKKATTPTIGRTLVEGNGVNLTSLLRHCNLSLTQFFNKITKWADMANMSDEFRHRIKRVEGNFAVSYNIFKKFTPIFNEIFKGPIETEPSRTPRNRKQRAPPCTPTKVFEFCWILFTTVKGENPPYCEDIVMSYHLLQACCDLAFKNAFLDDRRDLLNPNFSELPSQWADPNYIISKDAPCIINYLCSKHNGLQTEAKYCKEYSWKNHLIDLFDRGVLQGNAENFTGLFDPANFDANLKNLTKAYETHLLNRGDFDERIFLAEYRRRLLLKEQALINSNGAVPFSPMSTPGDAMVTDSPRGESSTPGTPGAARRSSASRLQGDFTPLSTATKSVTRLQALLAGRLPNPSETLIQLFQSCTNDPTEKIKQVVERIGEKFRTEFTRLNSNLPTVPPDYANQRLQLAITLFYKFVENIFQKEKTLHRDISHLAEQDVFYECTLACSLEIIIYSYNCQRKFPWILNALNIKPFYFVRVIELIVRSQDQLPRDAVKHLNMVEQKIIESLIWKSESPIWEVLTNSGEEFPKFEDIALPGNMVYTEAQGASGNIRKAANDQLQSPGPSAVDRFQSPVANPPVTEIRKQLFKPSQQAKPAHIIIIDKDGNKQYIPLPEKQLESILSKSEISQPKLVESVQPTAVPGRSKKTGSLSILLRKFYNLAYSRMEHLCGQLDISELKFRQKIWTVFEHSIREYHTDLMRDRHLDQLLMCAIYVVCKVTSTRERKFAEIMEHYRVQPQANSHIYRNVLITRGSGMSNDTHGDNAGNQTPNRNSTGEGEKRGDLISFYNTVYVQAMRTFALQFSSSSNQNVNITLSPLPLLVNNNLVSPRCQITNNLFIMPYDTPTNNCFSKGKTLEYHFSRSPSKDLEKINNAINKSIIGKRLLGDDDEADAPNKRFVSRKMQSLVEARLNHNTE